KEALAVSRLSETVTTTLLVAAAPDDTVPLIRPLTALMLNPVGRPTAENVSTSPSGSLATTCRETVAFTAVVRFPGFVTDGARLAPMVHVNWTLDLLPAAFAALALTRYGLDAAAPALMMPLIRTVEALMVRPPGRLVAV